MSNKIASVPTSLTLEPNPFEQSFASRGANITDESEPSIAQPNSSTQLSTSLPVLQDLQNLAPPCIPQNAPLPSPSMLVMGVDATGYNTRGGLSASIPLIPQVMTPMNLARQFVTPDESAAYVRPGPLAASAKISQVPLRGPVQQASAASQNLPPRHAQGQTATMSQVEHSNHQTSILRPASQSVSQRGIRTSSQPQSRSQSRAQSVTQMAPQDSNEPEEMTFSHKQHVQTKAADDKRRHFLERNRLAAVKCRQRKKQWVEGLVKKAEYFAQLHRTVEIDNARLRSQIEQIRAFLFSQADTSCLPQHIIHALDPGPPIIPPPLIPEAVHTTGTASANTDQIQSGNRSRTCSGLDLNMNMNMNMNEIETRGTPSHVDLCQSRMNSVHTRIA